MQESNLYKFVESLFAEDGKRLSNGFSVEMVGEPRFLVIRLFDDKDRNSVEIIINGKSMGRIVPYNGQGYSYEFQQLYRDIQLMP
ncbi:MAG: hypothetical protein OSJ56_13465 [Prevotella sp.]|nr:hypothetical protein [Prevotella sp.]